MKRFIVGIDPGARGALAIIRDGVLEVHDLKFCYKKTGSFNSLDPVEFEWLVTRMVPSPSADVAIFCEESLTFHKDGIKTAPPIFDSRGVLRSEFQRRGYEFNYIQPQTWKRLYGLLRQDKSASVEKACELFPESKDLFWKAYCGQFIPLDGRAEAALIAHYGLSFTPQPERKRHVKTTK